MSLRSVVKLLNADSIAVVSVFASTTRKFFAWSAPALTCCSTSQHLWCTAVNGSLTPHPYSRQEQASYGILDAMLAAAPTSLPWRARSYLISDNCKKLPVLEIRL